MEINITWGTTVGNDLETELLYQILSLRNDVFIVEQHCPYQDIDGLDLRKDSVHVWGKVEEKIVAYARILNSNSLTDTTRIGRVIINSQLRGQRLGFKLLEKTLEYIRSQPNQALIKLSSQSHLINFYGNFGFIPVSSEYLEDDIPHIAMELQLK